jgi:uncharacterized protein YjbI with pentapeptide repeats
MKLIIYFFMTLTCFELEAYNSHHIALLKQAVAQRKPINISGCDFRGATTLLQGIDFSNAIAGNVNCDTCSKITGILFLTEVLGQKTDLTGSNFSGANLRSASFKGAILTGANFSGADVSFANFAQANLTTAVFTGATGIETAVFCGATMPDGSICSGKSWTSKKGQLFLCQCPKKQ